MEHFEEAMDEAQRSQKEKLSNQSSFFDHSIPALHPEKNGLKSYQIPDDVPEWDHKKLLSIEREALGFYITGHPLLRFADRLKLVTNANSSNLNTKRDKDNVIIAGVVNGISEKKEQEEMTLCVT